jgi:hypothetical protein
MDLKCWVLKNLFNAFKTHGILPQNIKTKPVFNYSFLFQADLKLSFLWWSWGLDSGSCTC